MFSSLFTIARLGILALAALSLAALTAAQLQPAPLTGSASLPNPWEAVVAERGSVELIHRGDGRQIRIEAPASESWEYVAAAPWVAEDGSMEAVGRFVAHATSEEGTMGLVRMRLPEAEVLERVELDVMPTGRPAWDPSHPDRVVFPGATGQLYSCTFGADGSSSVAALEWRCEAFDGRAPFMIDPTWLRLPGPRNLLMVSLTPVRRVDAGTSGPPIAPWWLELDAEGEAIVAAGPMFDPEDAEVLDPLARLRYPDVVVGGGERMQLVYMRYEPAQGGATAYGADLEVDPESGRPHVRRGSASPLRDASIALGPLMRSVDGCGPLALPPGGSRIAAITPSAVGSR